MRPRLDGSCRRAGGQAWAVTLLVATALLALAACGGGAGSGAAAPSSQASPPQSPQPGAEATAPVLRPGSVLTVDDLVAAGWKKSKQFGADLVPAAQEVWYGFYDKRDIEVRIYASHDDARGPGAQSAEEAVARSPNSNIGGGIITTGGNRVQYHAYAVVGNVVLLCQQDVDVCLRLIERLPKR